MNPVVFLEFTYEPTPAFFEWLEKHKPGVYREVKKREYTHSWKIRTCYDPVTGVTRRCQVNFPFCTVANENAADFDRRVTGDEACCVLDDHPFQLSLRPLSAIVLANTSVGDTIQVDARRLLRLLSDPFSVRVPVKVVDKFGWFLKVELPDGQKVKLDVDCVSSL